MSEKNGKQGNRLGTEPVSRLLNGFAIPSIIAMLVSSLYNIVDQFFIGRSVGELGNAATNIAFPFSISCISIALLCGIGGAAAFNLAMGAGDHKKAGYYIGNSASVMVTGGVILAAIVLCFTDPLLKAFGSPAEVLGYARTYTRVCAFGFPFLILSAGGAHLVRADGSPRTTMVINLTGAVINTILDATFVFGFHWGMFGAALATIIGQIVAASLVIRYLMHFKTIPLTKAHFVLHRQYAGRVASLGTAPCITQLSLMVFQIVMNNSLKYYGSLSEYGESIPIACVGIISKVSQVAFSFVIGISQGMQPIVSFNYGAKNYARVKETYLLALRNSAFVTVTAFILFQVFPRQIIGIFGRGSDLYFKFGVRYFHVFLFFIFICFLQPMTSNFFTAIGKPKKGIFLSLTRQIIFLVPLILILPLFMGIDGIMYAGPVADLMAAVSAFLLARNEFRRPEFQA